MALPTQPRDGRALERTQLPFHRSFNRGGEGPVVCDEDGLRRLVVLGLGEQVRRNPVRIVGAVGDDQHLGRTSDHVDAHLTEDAPLGRCYIGVAGADDLIDRCDAVGAEGESCYCLSPADPVDLVHPHQAGGCQDEGIDLAAGMGDDHGQAADAGDFGRQGVHQNG